MDTNTKIESAAEFIRKLITNAVKDGRLSKSTVDGQPTRDNIEKSIGWILLSIYDPSTTNAVMDIAYAKLRKNGIIAKLRGENQLT